MYPSQRRILSNSATSGFTLIELLVVITILGILMSLAFTGSGAIRNQARSAQARNDCASVSTAIKAFYTDYSRYPVSATKADDAPYEPDTTQGANSEVIDALTAFSSDVNPRGVKYYDGKAAKRNSAGLYAGGLYPFSSTPASSGLFDPWGYTYGICVDGDNDGTLKYSGSKLKFYQASPGDIEDAVWQAIPGNVGVFSLGKDQCSSEKTSPAPGILSWY